MRAWPIVLLCAGCGGLCTSCNKPDPVKTGTPSKPEPPVAAAELPPVPAPCVEAGPPPPDVAGPPRLISAKAVEGGAITLTFSEPVAPSRRFDPNQFRLSGVKVDRASEVIEYMVDDLFTELDGQTFSFTRMDQPSHDSLRLWPSHPIEDGFCEELDEHRLGMHFADGPGTVLDRDGEQLAEIVPYWVTSASKRLAITRPDRKQRPMARTVSCEAKPTARPPAPLCQGTPRGLKLPKRPRITEAKLDAGLHSVSITFSEPVAEVGKLDPQQFRLSVWSQDLETHRDAGSYVQPDRSMCNDDADYYSSDECIHDWDWSEHPREVELVRGSKSAASSITLRLNGKFGPSTCTDLTEHFDAPLDGLFLHFQDRPGGGLATQDGRRLRDISEPWVRFRAQYMDGQPSVDGRPPAQLVKCEG